LGGPSMTKWDDICRVASAFGATELSATAWMFEMHGSATAMQKVFVSYEVMEPDLEFIQLRSPIAGIDGADCDAILGEYGQLLVGSMGYVPTWKEVGTEVDGWLALISTIPLALLDLSDEANFLIYCNLIARAAEEIGQSTQAGGIAETADKDAKASTGGASRAFSSAVSHLDAESMKKGAARAL